MPDMKEEESAHVFGDLEEVAAFEEESGLQLNVRQAHYIAGAGHTTKQI